MRHISKQNVFTALWAGVFILAVLIFPSLIENRPTLGTGALLAVVFLGLIRTQKYIEVFNRED